MEPIVIYVIVGLAVWLGAHRAYRRLLESEADLYDQPDMGELQAGEFIAAKYRDQAAKSGAHRAALNMRKQGFPLHVTSAVLLGKILR